MSTICAAATAESRGAGGRSQPVLAITSTSAMAASAAARTRTEALVPSVPASTKVAASDPRMEPAVFQAYRTPMLREPWMGSLVNNRAESGKAYPMQTVAGSMITARCKEEGPTHNVPSGTVANVLRPMPLIATARTPGVSR